MPRHHDVGDHQVDRARRLAAHSARASRSAGRGQHPVARPARAVAGQVADRRLVFDEQDRLAAARRNGSDRSVLGRLGAGALGQVDLERCPAPGAVSIRTWPPLCSHDPVDGGEAEARPLAERLGRKKGSKIRASVAASMPAPVSVTASTRSDPARLGAARCRAPHESTVGLDRHRSAAASHRAVHGQVQDYCSIWPLSATDEPIAGRVHDQCDVLADHAFSILSIWQ